MTQLPLAEIVERWQARFARRHPSAETVAATRQVIRTLSRGKPVPPSSVEGVIWDWYENECCGQFDEQGRIVGMALSLQPTSHRFEVGGRQLYAWCALDTLFLPGIIGLPARVNSTCPVSREPIHLTVTLEGVEDVTPATTVLSVVVPDHTPNCSCGAAAGPDSPICSQMHFYRSQREATRWLADHPGVALLTLEEAWQLVEQVWLPRYARSADPGG